MKKYIRVTEQSTSNSHDTHFCVTESEHEDYSDAKVVLTCDVNANEFFDDIRWLICTKYGLRSEEYEHSCCDYSEAEYYNGAAQELILETTETYAFEAEV